LLFAHIAADEVAFQGRTPDGRIVPVAIDRHTLLSLSMSAALGDTPVDALGLLDSRHPIDPDMLRRLRVIRRLLNESDNWLGPGSLLPVVRQMYQVGPGPANREGRPASTAALYLGVSRS